VGVDCGQRTLAARVESGFSQAERMNDYCQFASDRCVLRRLRLLRMKILSN
jgi:hypothetical protein